ncbi:transposase domain protein [Escherichia coli 2-316-03_S4_C2]|nr:transposase domain protein [Escherichia coli 2-316-03_S4_C2]
MLPEQLCCARSSIGRWINLFTLSGVEDLKSLPSVRGIFFVLLLSF